MAIDCLRDRALDVVCMKVIRCMVELGLHTRPQLREHVDRDAGGWRWCVEWLPDETG